MEHPAQPQTPNAAATPEDPTFDPEKYVRRTLELFEAGRKELGPEIELLHDVHERVSPRLAVQFAKDMEQFRLFFLEDALSPENIEYFRQIRANCTTPLAMGELFNNPHEWTLLIKDSLIDYIRVHVSQAGGLTPALKIANLAEAFQVRTAWHGPGDVSPIGTLRERNSRYRLPKFWYSGMDCAERASARSFRRLSSYEGRVRVS